MVKSSNSKCVHFRYGNAAVSKLTHKTADNILETVEKRKYLGVIVQEKNNFCLNCEDLVKGGGRALGSIIIKMQNLKDFGFSSYERLFDSVKTRFYHHSESKRVDELVSYICSITVTM